MAFKAIDQVEELLGISFDWKDRSDRKPHFYARRNRRDFIVSTAEVGLYRHFVWKIYEDRDDGGDAHCAADSRYSFETVDEAKADIERFARENGY